MYEKSLKVLNFSFSHQLLFFFRVDRNFWLNKLFILQWFSSLLFSFIPSLYLHTEQNKTNKKKIKPGGFFIKQHDIFNMAENNEKGCKALNFATISFNSENGKRHSITRLFAVSDDGFCLSRLFSCSTRHTKLKY